MRIPDDRIACAGYERKVAVGETRQEEMSNGRPYTVLGEVMDELARKRNIRGPHRIANYIEARLGDAPSGVAVSKWMYGDTVPKPDKIEMFAEAFELSPRERAVLAYAYTFRLPTAA